MCVCVCVCVCVDINRRIGLVGEGQSYSETSGAGRWGYLHTKPVFYTLVSFLKTWA